MLYHKQVLLIGYLQQLTPQKLEQVQRLQLMVQFTSTIEEETFML